MKKIYNSKAFWMIVSLLASLAIWVYVTSVETDESKTPSEASRSSLWARISLGIQRTLS